MYTFLQNKGFFHQICIFLLSLEEYFIFIFFSKSILSCDMIQYQQNIKLGMQNEHS